MDITVTQDNAKSIISIPDTLNAITSPFLKNTLSEVISAADEIDLDFSETGLVSSAGLRVLMQAEKNVQKSGKIMTLKNVSPEVMEVFNMTGVSKIFKIV